MAALTSRLTVRLYPDPVLRQVAEPVARITDSTRRLVDAMFEAMDRYEGVGLAAPQVGVLQRILVLDPTPFEEDRPREALLNPEVVSRSGSCVETEGCLSLPGIQADIRRTRKIEVKATTLDGAPRQFTADGMQARIILHELDHLDGKLMIDRVAPWKRKRLLARLHGASTTARQL